MSQLLCKGVQKLLGERLFEAALLPNQNMLPCVRYVGFKLWVSINHIRYQKKYIYFLFKYCLVRRRWGLQIGYISVQGQTT